MKKWIALLLALVLALSLTACSKGMADGVYTAELDDASAEAAHGWRDTLVVEYKDGKIVSATFESYDADGNKKSEATAEEPTPATMPRPCWKPLRRRASLVRPSRSLPSLSNSSGTKIGEPKRRLSDFFISFIGRGWGYPPLPAGPPSADGRRGGKGRWLRSSQWARRTRYRWIPRQCRTAGKPDPPGGSDR